jgi:hypothetical protein
MGTLHSRVWLAVRELTIPNTIIDPGYKGVLRIIIFNHGENSDIITLGDYIGKIVLFKLDAEVSRGIDKQNDRGDIVHLHNNMAKNISNNYFLKNTRAVGGGLFVFLCISILLIYLFVDDKNQANTMGLLVIFAQFILFLAMLWK